MESIFSSVNCFSCSGRYSDFFLVNSTLWTSSCVIVFQGAIGGVMVSLLMFMSILPLVVLRSPLQTVLPLISFTYCMDPKTDRIK